MDITADSKGILTARCTYRKWWKLPSTIIIIIIIIIFTAIGL